MLELGFRLRGVVVGRFTQHKRTAPGKSVRLVQLTERQQYARKIRSSGAWQKLQARKLQEDPLCCDPFGNHDRHEPAQQVHHIEPIVERPDLALDWDNLASVCTECHGRLNAMERSGKPTHHLFADTGGGVESLIPPALDRMANSKKSVSEFHKGNP